MIVVQEIFGVNSHIREVTDTFARHGYLAWAPAYFDPIERGVELGYDHSVYPRARELVASLGWDAAVAITRSAATLLKTREPHLSRHVVGYCWGGAVAWLAATRMGPELVDSAAAYYGRAISEFKNETARSPIIMHFGEHDTAIPMELVREIQTAQPTVPVYIYNAGHGFNCNQRKDYNAESAALALQRTLDFFEAPTSGKRK